MAFLIEKNTQGIMEIAVEKLFNDMNYPHNNIVLQLEVINNKKHGVKILTKVTKK